MYLLQEPFRSQLYLWYTVYTCDSISARGMKSNKIHKIKVQDNNHRQNTYDKKAKNIIISNYCSKIVIDGVSGHKLRKNLIVKTQN